MNDYNRFKRDDYKYQKLIRKQENSKMCSLNGEVSRKQYTLWEYIEPSIQKLIKEDYAEYYTY